MKCCQRRNTADAVAALPSQISGRRRCGGRRQHSSLHACSAPARPFPAQVHICLLSLRSSVHLNDYALSHMTYAIPATVSPDPAKCTSGVHRSHLHGRRSCAPTPHAPGTREAVPGSPAPLPLLAPPPLLSAAVSRCAPGWQAAQARGCPPGRFTRRGAHPAAVRLPSSSAAGRRGPVGPAGRSVQGEGGRGTADMAPLPALGSALQASGAQPNCSLLSHLLRTIQAQVCASPRRLPEPESRSLLQSGSYNNKRLPSILAAT